MQASRGPSVTSAAAAGPAELWEGISSGPRNQPTLRHGCCRQPAPETCRQKGAVKRHQGGRQERRAQSRDTKGGRQERRAQSRDTKGGRQERRAQSGDTKGAGKREWRSQETRRGAVTRRAEPRGSAGAGAACVGLSRFLLDLRGYVPPFVPPFSSAQTNSDFRGCAPPFSC